MVDIRIGQSFFISKIYLNLVICSLFIKTCRILSGILFTSDFSVNFSIYRQFHTMDFPNFWIDWYYRSCAQTDRNRWSHRFSIGLRSGLHGECSSNSLLFTESHVFMSFETWIDALFCWKKPFFDACWMIQRLYRSVSLELFWWRSFCQFAGSLRKLLMAFLDRPINFEISITFLLQFL